MRQRRKWTTDREANDMRVRRIGTVTLGLGLLVFGTLFLVHTFWDGLSYGIILRCWPLLLISLGVETLWSLREDGESRWGYDKGAVGLMILLSLFAMMMAAAQFCMEMSIRYGIQ